MLNLKILLLAVGAALVVYLAYHAVQICRHIRISTRLVEAAKPFIAEREGGSRLLVVGDSTAVGVGASSPSYTTAGYFVADNPAYSVTNLAVSGAKVADVLAQIRGAGEAYELVLIQAGGNDVIRFTSLEGLRADYKELLAEAKKRSGKVVALSTGNIGQAPLFKFFPLNSIYEARTRSVRHMLKEEAAAAGITYVDLFKEGYDEINEHPERYYAPDGLHLNDAGWNVWYQDIKKAAEGDK